MIDKDSDRQRKQTAQEHPPVSSIDTQDRVDEASYDSFPGSDAPAHSSGHARSGPWIPAGKPVRKSRR